MGTLAPSCCDVGSQQLTSAQSLEYRPQPTQAVSPEKAWGLLPPPGGGSGGTQSMTGGQGLTPFPHGVMFQASPWDQAKTDNNSG